MGACGAAYILLGACMLISVTKYKKHLNGLLLDISGLYPSLFKGFDLAKTPQKSDQTPMQPVDDGEGYGDGETMGSQLFSVGEEELGYEGSPSPMQERLLANKREESENPQLVFRALAFRLLAYLLILFGLCRLISAFYFGCGYVYMGMASCLLEIGIVSTELLQHRSMRLHGAMSVLLELGILSEIYLGTAIPFCHV